MNIELDYLKLQIFHRELQCCPDSSRQLPYLYYSHQMSLYYHTQHHNVVYTKQFSMLITTSRIHTHMP